MKQRSATWDVVIVFAVAMLFIAGLYIAFKPESPPRWKQERAQLEQEIESLELRVTLRDRELRAMKLEAERFPVAFDGADAQHRPGVPLGGLDLSGEKRVRGGFVHPDHHGFKMPFDPGKIVGMNQDVAPGNIYFIFQCD